MKPNEITREIIGSAIEVHRELGPGKPELAYEAALAHELFLRGLEHCVQRPVPVVYKGVRLECGYRLDLLVDERIVVEVKAVELVHPVHRAQVLTYLKLGGWRLALLLNFNVAVLKDGIERFVFGFDGAAFIDKSVEQRATQKSCQPEGPERASRLWSSEDSGDAKAEALAREVIASALEVHRELGVGLLRSTYEMCLAHELSLRGVPFELKQPLALHYKGVALNASDQLDMLVGGRLVVTPYAVATLEPLHEGELRSQLRLGGWNLGLMVNFSTLRLTDGLRRIVWRRGTSTD